MRVEERLISAYYTEAEVKQIEELLGKKLPHKFTKSIETMCKCDICDKVIDDGKKFIHVLIGHYDWGNDSIESQQWLDICCEACLKTVYQNFIDMKSDTKYININYERLDLR